MSSPILYGGNNTSNSLQNQLLLATGELIANNGPKNYFKGGQFENNNVNGFTLAHTTLSNFFPNQVSGSWSSANANTTLTLVTGANSLSGLYSLSFNQNAASTVGDMIVSAPMTVDTENQGHVLSFKFSYQCHISPGNANFSGTSANSFGIAIYDVTNSAWVQPDSVFGLNQTVSAGYSTGSFQLPINTTQFRFVIYNANATIGPTALTIDSLYIGPNNVVSSSLKTPTVQVFTSGSGTYTPPTNPPPTYLKVIAVGGGGGGSGSGTSATNGVAGGSSTFGTSFLSANAGSGGIFGVGGSNGGAGGTLISIPTGAVGYSIPGGVGSGGFYQSTGVMNMAGGAGGTSALGGTGAPVTGSSGGAAGVNTGSGGAGGGVGASSGVTAGAGGGSGAYLCVVVPSVTTYPYVVGAGGGGGGSGGSGTSGGTGGEGIIIVEEHYDGFGAGGDASGRIIAASYTATTAQSFSTNPTNAYINYNNPIFDTNASSSNPSGYYQYTAQVSGYYKVDASVSVSGGSVGSTSGVLSITLNKNGSAIQTGPQQSFYGQSRVVGAPINTLVWLNAGDYLNFGINFVGGSAPSLDTSSASNIVSIHKLSGSAVVQASASVNASYNGCANILTNNTTITLNYLNMLTDSHNQYNYSTGTYTIPVAGPYDIYAALTQIGSATAGSESLLSILKNGTIIAQTPKYIPVANETVATQVNTIIPCVAGDLITITYLQAGGSSISPSTTAYQNWFNIHKI